MATTAVLNLGLNSSQFDRGIKKSSKKLIGFQKTSIGVGTVVGAMLTGAMARMGWGMIKLASDAEETGSKFEAVFKGINKESEMVAKSFAQNFGLAESTSKDLLSSTGDLLTGFGFTTGKALELSSQVNSLAVDLSSFQNFSGGAKGASQALTKALLGETESAKSLGIVIRQNSKEFKNEVAQVRKATGATEQQAKTQVIFNQILKQSKNAIGDYARTSESTANRIQLMGQRWQELQEGIGKFLIDGLEVDKILGMISGSMKELAENANTVKLALSSLTTNVGSGIAKTWIQTKGVLEDSINGYKLLWTKITGSDGEFKRLQSNIKFEENIRKAMLEGVEKHKARENKKSQLKWIESEKKKSKVTVSQAENAIKKAIEKTTGVTVDSTTKTSSGSISQPQQLESAVLKGSIEAFKQENTVANKVQNKQLKELVKQSAELSTIADNQSQEQVANF